MAERPRQPQPTDREIERALRELRARLDYPPTPDLATTVRARLQAQPRRSRSVWAPLVTTTPPRRLALAALAIVLLAGALLLLSPATRSAVADRLGVRGIPIVYLTPTLTTPTLTPAPSATPTPTAVITTSGGSPATSASSAASPTRPPATPPTATPESLGERFGLGRPVTLTEARAAAQYTVLAPTLPELGQPDEVYFSPLPSGGQVSCVYYPRPGLPVTSATGVGMLLTQFQGAVEPEFFGKGIGPETRLEQVTVNGGRGFWLEGKPHFFIYRDANGRTTSETIRLAGNTLIWEQNGVTFRLEAALSKDEALRVAASLR